MVDEKLIAACDRAVAENQMTSGGLPKVDFLGAVVGREVTATERDAAWAALRDKASINRAELDQAEPNQVEQDTSGSLVYIGPTVKTPHPVKQYTVFKALPAAVAAWKAGDRQVGRLFVPVSGLAAARQKVKDHQSGLGRAYAAVQAAYGRVS